MTAIVSVTDGVTAYIDDHVNQYKDALSAVLGITDTGQDALGRLVLPRSTSHPGAPSTGMVNYRTDLGLAGRQFIRDSTGLWVPYLPLRQISETDFAAFSTTSAAFVDVTGATVSLTTTGGIILIGILPSRSTIGGDAIVKVSSIGAAAAQREATGKLKALVGATSLNEMTVGAAHIYSSAISAEVTRSLPIPFPLWYYKPAAGTYTVKLQALQNGTATTTIYIGASGATMTWFVVELAD